MSEAKYYITIDNHTVAENMTLSFAMLFVEAIFQKYWQDHDMVVAIAEMERCQAVEEGK